ncbi:MAG: MltA domain-containing protein [Hyphomicrobium sp.]|nr:MltA domain-containing protein [Hyphomicrobium sp.]
MAVFVVAGGSYAEPASKLPPQSTIPQPAMSKDATPQTPGTKLAPAKPPEANLERVTFGDLPSWEADEHLAAFKTFLKSCEAAIKAAAKPASGAPAQCKVPSGELAAACRAAQNLKAPTKASAKAFFENQFVPHRIAHPKGQGLLTGYYEPVLEGSRTAQGKFQTPVYRRPPDLVNVVAEADRASMPTGLTHVRQTAAGVAPFPTRAEIEQGALTGQSLELLYLEDPVEVFFMHIQGSGRIHLTDGTTVRINYDGKNGHPYSSIGRYLIDQGLVDAGKMSMQALGKWLRADKERGQKVMWQNQSFIFFRELDDSDGPMGAMQVALTPGRSLAVDTGYHTLGTPIYLSVPELAHAAKRGGFNRLMVAQDVGSAIKGPERGDIYFGSGVKAGKLAGTTRHAGNFYVLLPAVTQTAGQGIRFGERLPWETIVKAAP